MSIAEQYMLLSLNENGKFSTLQYCNQMIGLLASSLFELSYVEVIQIQNNNIIVKNKLPENLSHLKPVYDFLLNDSKPTLEKTFNNFILTFKLKNGDLFDAIGNSLANAGLVKIEEKCGLVKKKKYVPYTKEKESTIERLKERLDNETASAPDYVLLEILKQTDQLVRLQLEEYKNRGEDSSYGNITKKMTDDLVAILTVCCII